jgi:hypothetical protein
MKQKGGFEPIFKTLSDRDFKYTTEKHRQEWTKTFYPYSPYFIQLIQEIPWNDYNFHGKNQFITENEIDVRHTEIELVELECKTNSNINYKFFGGSVYELLNIKFKKSLGIDIKDYIDPTGDLDIQIDLPCLELLEGDLEKSYQYKFLIEKPEGITMTNLGEHLSRWIFTNFLTKLRQIEPQFSKIFPNSMEFDYREDDEAENSDIAERIGNLWLVRTHSDSFIKVQLVMKISIKGESDYISHILEFVLSSNLENTIEENHCNSQLFKIYDYSGFPTQTLEELVRGNLSSYKTRIALYGGPLQYKLFNHSRRMLYLNEIIKRGFGIIERIKDGRRINATIKSEINSELKNKIGLPYDEFNNLFQIYISFYKELYRDKEGNQITPWERLLIGQDRTIEVRDILGEYRNELIEEKYGVRISKLGTTYKDFLERLGFL